VNGLYDIKLCGSNTVECHIDHSSQLVLSVFYLPNFLLLSLVFAYIYISQSSVETHLLCGGIERNHAIANCLYSVTVKKF